MPHLGLLQQQQSLLSQQVALNRLRGHGANPLLASTINNNINLHAANVNLGANTVHNRVLSTTPTAAGTLNAAPNTTLNGVGNIPQSVLNSTIAELKQVMQNSSDQAAVTVAINAAFAKLGANDPESKKQLLQQLVATCSGQQSANTMGGGAVESKGRRRRRGKSKSRKRKSSRRKDKDRKPSRRGDRDDRESDGRRHRHRRRKRRDRSRDRGSRGRDSGRDRSDGGTDGDSMSNRSRSASPEVTVAEQDGKEMPPLQNSSGTDFPDPDVDDDGKEENERKRKLEDSTVSVPDFNDESPPRKKQKMDAKAVEQVDLTMTSASDGADAAKE